MTKLAVTVDDQTFEVELDLSHSDGMDLVVKVDGEPVRVRLPDRNAPPEQMEWIVVDDRPYELVFDRELRWVRSHSRSYPLEVHNGDRGRRRPQSRDGRVKAPIPGQITQVMVQPGQRVEAGQRLLTLEAMKMENEIRAPRSGFVSSVHAAVGQTVSLNEVLVEIS